MSGKRGKLKTNVDVGYCHPHGWGTALTPVISPP